MYKRHETWFPIVRYKNYEVSDLGNVRSLKRQLKPFKSGRYLQVSLYRDGVRKIMLVHRLVAKAFLPNLENKHEVNHIDNDGRNNWVKNLEWCTNSENTLHATRVTMTLRPWNKGRALVNRNRPCDFCNQTFSYRKLRQRFCSNHCSQQARLVCKENGYIK